MYTKFLIYSFSLYFEMSRLSTLGQSNLVETYVCLEYMSLEFPSELN